MAKRFFSLMTLLGTIPCVFRDDSLDEDASVVGVDEATTKPDGNVVIVNGDKTTPLLRNVPTAASMLPLAGPVIVDRGRFTDMVGRNDCKEQLSPRGFSCQNKDELIDAIKRFNTLPGGKVNPQVLSWILTPTFEKVVARFFDDYDDPAKLSKVDKRVFMVE